MYFSDTLVSTSVPLFMFTPQITNDTSANPLTDKIGWTRISGSFVASGGEHYIVIGSFVNDASSDIVILPTGSYYAPYYYIDDVSAVDFTDEGVSELSDDGGVSIYPNPSEGMFTISSTKFKIESIKIYNVLGELMITETPNNNQSTINISQYSKGIYFVKIMDEKKNVVNRKIIIQ